MSDELISMDQGPRATRTRRSLTRIADALGVPVSSLYDEADGGSMISTGSNLDAGTVLALVRTYLRGVDAETRGRFVQAVMTMAKEG